MNKAEEVLQIKEAVRMFAGEMERKLVEKARAGWEGWDHPHFKKTAEIRLLEHAGRLIQGQTRQAIDVANFAMFAWWIAQQKENDHE